MWQAGGRRPGHAHPEERQEGRTLKVVIANFSRPIRRTLDFRSYWRQHTKPETRPRVSLFEQRPDWGFHIYALGVYLMDLGLADQAEFWDYAEERSMKYRRNGALRVLFWNEDDIRAYLDRHGDPDLFINYGRYGEPMLDHFAGRCFRIHIPCERWRGGTASAECYLVDSEADVGARCMLYVPVVNTRKIFPTDGPTHRDFIYLAAVYPQKRHDLLLDAIRGTELTGHLHPVEASQLDLHDTRVTTSNWNERDVVELLRTSRIAVYPGDRTSNPAAMWECVAAGLPMVMNENIEGGKHLVVPGITGEFANEHNFADVMRYVLERRGTYAPREYFEAHWDTVTMLERYLAFFRDMGWTP